MSAKELIFLCKIEASMRKLGRATKSVEMLTCKLSLKFERESRFGRFGDGFSSKKRDEPQYIDDFYLPTKGK